MTRFIVNIGLDIKATTSISAHVAKEILVANGFTIYNAAVVQSDTEPTLVAEVALFDGPSVVKALYETAVDLGQECIAAYQKGLRSGFLVGPEREKWGAFDPERFFLIDGSRLGHTVHAASRQDLDALKAALSAINTGATLVVVEFDDGSPAITYTQAHRSALIHKVLYSV